MSWVFLFATALAVTSVESRSLPRRNAVLVPQVADLFGNPLFFEAPTARTAYEPQREMLFTGFYRPSRRSGVQQGDTASSVYAQGSSIGGGAYFSQPHYYLTDSFEPSDDGDSAEPEASGDDDGQKQDESDDQLSDKPDLEHRPSRKPSSKPHSKKPKKMPKPVEPQEEEYDGCDDQEEEEDEEDNEPLTVRPSKGRRRNKQQQQPNLNTYFPTVFNIPRTSTSRGNPGSIPDMISAVANSYSTGKGGVASAVATAYGNPPSNKPRRVSSKP